MVSDRVKHPVPNRMKNVLVVDSVLPRVRRDPHLDKLSCLPILSRKVV